MLGVARLLLGPAGDRIVEALAGVDQLEGGAPTMSLGASLVVYSPARPGILTRPFRAQAPG